MGSTSCEGYLTMRPSVVAPPPMIRRYVVLIGTTLWIYNSQEDAEHMMNLFGQNDVAGVGDWDGRGASHLYYNAFRIVTAQRRTWYCYADTQTEKEKWMRSLETIVMVMGVKTPSVIRRTPENSPVSYRNSPSQQQERQYQTPDKEDQQQLQPHKQLKDEDQQPQASQQQPKSAKKENLCPISGLPARHKCHSCLMLFSDKHINNEVPLLHAGFCSPVRVCDDCYNTQRFLNYIQAMVERFEAGTCLYPESLNPDCPIELHKASATSQYSAGAIALDLFSKGAITMEELQQLIQADLRYQDETAKNFGMELDMEILSLHKSFAQEGFGVAEAVVLLHKNVARDVSIFKPIVEQLLRLSYSNLNDIEFYWPQIVHAYLRIPIFFDLKKLFWLEDLIVSICTRSIHLALHLVWQLQGALEDAVRLAADMKASAKFPRIIRLMLLVESTVVGKSWSYNTSGRGTMKAGGSRVGPPQGSDQQAHLIEDLLYKLETFRMNRSLATANVAPSAFTGFCAERERRRRTLRMMSGVRGLGRGEQRETDGSDNVADPPLSVRTKAMVNDASSSSSLSSSTSISTSSITSSTSHERTFDTSPSSRVAPHRRLSLDDDEILFCDLSKFQQHLLQSSPHRGHTAQHQTKLSTDIESNSLKLSKGHSSASGSDGGPQNTLTNHLSSRQSHVEAQSSEDASPPASCAMMRVTDKDKDVLSAFFQNELAFAQDLTNIAERLRLVYPPSKRKERLPEELKNFFIPENAYIPLERATRKFSRVVRVPSNEGTVFSTRERAPTMIIFEVVKASRETEVFVGPRDLSITATTSSSDQSSLSSSSSTTTTTTFKSSHADTSTSESIATTYAPYSTISKPNDSQTTDLGNSAKNANSIESQGEKEQLGRVSIGTVYSSDSGECIAAYGTDPNTDVRATNEIEDEREREKYKNEDKDKDKAEEEGEIDQGQKWDPSTVAMLEHSGLSVSVKGVMDSEEDDLEREEIELQEEEEEEGEDDLDLLIRHNSPQGLAQLVRGVELDPSDSFLEEEQVADQLQTQTHSERARETETTLGRDLSSPGTEAAVDGACASGIKIGRDASPLETTTAMGGAPASGTQKARDSSSLQMASPDGGPERDPAPPAPPIKQRSASVGENPHRGFSVSERSRSSDDSMADLRAGRGRPAGAEDVDARAGGRLTPSPSASRASSVSSSSSSASSSSSSSSSSTITTTSTTASPSSASASGPSSTLNSPSLGPFVVDRQAEAELSSKSLSLEERAQHDEDLSRAFGESWDQKVRRIRHSSPVGHLPGWGLVSLIAKSNDDLRQEVFLLQLVQKFIDIFTKEHLPLWLQSYRVIATSSSAGLVETLTNASSLDALKKRKGFHSLRQHFIRSYGPPTSHGFKKAQRAFVQSMAGYSLLTYFLQVKDRHNGNIMVDSQGHIIHIDFGFILGHAPGGSFSIETAPFKLTAEMVELMDGADSPTFGEFVKLCTRGFLTLQRHVDEIIALVEIMGFDSPFPCFQNRELGYVLQRLRGRFKTNLDKNDTVAHVLWLVKKSNNNYYTRQYDNFQKFSNGIMP